MEMNKSVEYLHALKELAKHRARENFWDFCLYVNYDFFTQRESMLKEIADELNHAWYQDEHEVYRINISIMRRIGKSYITMLFMAWASAKDNTIAINRVSFNDEKARELHDVLRMFIITNEFFKEVFPTIEVEIFNSQQIRYKGSTIVNVSSNGLGKGTGSGFSIGIADDIYKNYEQAKSEAINKKKKQDYDTTFSSSLEGKKRIEIVINTRWSKGELADEFENQGYFHKIIKKKALVNGVSQAPYVMSTEQMLERQKRLPLLFNAMYQQEYSEAENGVLDTSRMRYIDYDQVPNGLRVAIVDNKTTGKDFYAVNIYNICYINGEQEIVLQDSIYTQESNSLELQRRIASFIEHYNCLYAFFEVNKDHTSYMNIKSWLPQINCKAFTTTTNKEARIISGGLFYSDFVFLDTEEKEYSAMLNSAISYDLLNKNEHDDSIDNMSMFVERIIRSKKYRKRLGLEAKWQLQM